MAAGRRSLIGNLSLVDNFPAAADADLSLVPQVIPVFSCRPEDIHQYSRFFLEDACLDQVFLANLRADDASSLECSELPVVSERARSVPGDPMVAAAAMRKMNTTPIARPATAFNPHFSPTRMARDCHRAKGLVSAGVTKRSDWD